MKEKEMLDWALMLGIEVVCKRRIYEYFQFWRRRKTVLAKVIRHGSQLQNNPLPLVSEAIIV